MNLSDLPTILANGEDSLHQFKRDITNATSLASELAAFANTEGGTLIIGVEDDGTGAGLAPADIRRLNQLIANVSTNNLNPPLNVLTRNTQLNGKTLMVVEVPSGPNRPYCDNQGVFWVKSGADKRRITSQQELRRIFQREGDLFGDEQPIPHAILADLHHPTLEAYVERIFDQPLDQLGIPTEQLLRNLKFYTQDTLNLTGLLMLAKRPQQFRPQFNVKAVSYFGNSLTGTEYRDRQDIDGRIPELYEGTMAFLLRNLRRIQAGQGFNSEGKLEIPRAALEEIVQNALIHRDYFISAPVQIMLFDDRLEVISPGTLPNSLTVEHIKTGAAIQRNPTLASRAFRVLPYNGLGSGVPRAVELVPDIQFDNQKDANQLVVTIPRPVVG
jgi:ATP-dependent DNA helicase RecG